MSSRVPSNLPASVEVSYSDSGLNIGVTIWDDSGSVPVQVTGLAGMVNGVLPLLNWSGVSYRFKHLGNAGTWYLYNIAAYVASNYLVVDTSQPQGSDSLYFDPPLATSGGAPNGITGLVESVVELTGIVAPDLDLVGTIQD